VRGLFGVEPWLLRVAAYAKDIRSMSKTFDTFGLNPALLQALASEGYTIPTPIQAQAIPDVMAGKDLLGIAQTGTGKTAAFALPILHRLSANRGASQAAHLRAS
jgi:ATP-dependent RNA helicase RhlE